MNRSIFISVLVLSSLLLTFASPTISAEEESPPPEVEYNPPFRMTSLFAQGQDTLSPELKEQPETYNHDFPAGPASGPSNGPTITTPSFVREASFGANHGIFHSGLVVMDKSISTCSYFSMVLN